jgi:hypothetical protein
MARNRIGRSLSKLEDKVNGFKIVKDLGVVLRSKTTVRRVIAICKRCDKNFEVPLYALRSGRTKSCGCLRKKLSSEDKSAYASWGYIKRSIHHRTYKYYDEYKKYGITMDPEWEESYFAFKRDMGLPPGKGYGLFRKDYKKGFYKENCYWGKLGSMGRRGKQL